MNTKIFASMCCAASLALTLPACGDDGGGNDDTGTTASVDDTTTDNPPGDDTTTDNPPADSTTDDGSDSTGEPPAVEYPDAPFEDYERVDRMGMPAVATVLITSKDAYNQASLQDDVDGMFVPEISGTLEALHGAIDDDITALGLTPCVLEDCLAVGAPLIVPDTISIDTDVDAGFPNGRLLADPVIDLTLAVLFLDLGMHDITTFVGVLNPPANDLEFGDSFPYLADPH